MIRVYGVPTCDKIRKTQKLLKDHRIDFEFIDVRKDPLPRAKLAEIVAKKGLDLVLNRKGMLYRKLGLKSRNLTDAQLFDEVFKEQGMIKRPLIENNTDYHIGYDEVAIMKFVK